MSKHWRRDPDGNLTLYGEPSRLRMPVLPLLFWPLLLVSLAVWLADAVVNHWI